MLHVENYLFGNLFYLFCIKYYLKNCIFGSEILPLFSSPSSYAYPGTVPLWPLAIMLLAQYTKAWISSTTRNKPTTFYLANCVCMNKPATTAKIAPLLMRVCLLYSRPPYFSLRPICTRIVSYNKCCTIFLSYISKTLIYITVWPKTHSVYLPLIMAMCRCAWLFRLSLPAFVQTVNFDLLLLPTSTQSRLKKSR